MDKIYDNCCGIDVHKKLMVLIADYGEANEENKSDFKIDENELIFQLKIYDQMWYVRKRQEVNK